MRSEIPTHRRSKTDIDELLLMYKKYHEMDIEHFVIELDRRRKNVFSESALKRFRAYAMLSQGELAERTGIPVRTIQQSFMQKDKPYPTIRL